MNEENTLTANEIYFQEVEDEHGKTLNLDESLRVSLVGLLMDRYASAQSARDQDETRWLTAYHNYRGLYGKHIRFRESEKSRVFVKVTKTKVLAAFGQLVDVVLVEISFLLAYPKLIFQRGLKNTHTLIPLWKLLHHRCRKKKQQRRN